VFVPAPSIRGFGDAKRSNGSEGRNIVHPFAYKSIGLKLRRLGSPGGTGFALAEDYQLTTGLVGKGHPSYGIKLIVVLCGRRSIAIAKANTFTKVLTKLVHLIGESTGCRGTKDN
jgi:hypothetical protein